MHADLNPRAAALLALAGVWSCSSSTPYEPTLTEDCVLVPGEVQPIDLGDRFTGPEGFLHAGMNVLVDEHTVLLTATGTEGSDESWDVEIVSYDLDDGTITQLTADDESVDLIDARGGRALLSGRETVVMDVSTTTVRALGEATRGPMFEGSFAARPRRMMVGAVVAWPGETGINIHDGDSTDLVPLPDMTRTGWPMVDDGAVYWTGRSDDLWQYELFRFRRGEQTVLNRSSVTLDSLYVDEGRAIWGTSEGISILDGESLTEVAMDSETGCFDTFVSGDIVAFVCNDSIYSYDLASDQVTRRAHPVDFEAHGSPRLNGLGAMAWIVIDDLCGGTGRLALEHRGHISEVARLRTDSYCVGHMPVPIALAMNDRYVIWADFEGVFYSRLACREGTGD